MSSERVGASEMLAVHNALRREYGSMPLLVKSVADGDDLRAGAIADHIALMGTFMALHHEGEDALLWPLVRERAPGSAGIVASEAEHVELAEHSGRVVEMAEVWRNDPSAANRAALHVELIALEREILHHLGHEEADALPLMVETVTDAEFAELWGYVRDGLSVEQRSIVLGMILEDTGAANASSVLGTLDPQERADFERNGEPAFRAYRARLLGS
jgi:hemerythrin-like domain-containing protein